METLGCLVQVAVGLSVAVKQVADVAAQDPPQHGWEGQVHCKVAAHLQASELSSRAP